MPINKSLNQTRVSPLNRAFFKSESESPFVRINVIGLWPPFEISWVHSVSSCISELPRIVRLLSMAIWKASSEKVVSFTTSTMTQYNDLILTLMNLVASDFRHLRMPPEHV